MTTVEYLEQIFDIDDRAGFYLQEAQKWRELATSLSVSYDKEPVKSSGNKQKIESAMVNAVYYEDKAKEKIGDLMERRDKIVGQIIDLEDRDSRDILYRYYVENKSTVDIADEIGYSLTHTRRKHRKALALFEKRYRKEYLNTNGRK